MPITAPISPAPSYDVVIIGAGVAGLSAAVEMGKTGRHPLLLEAAGIPGGRARSHFDPRFERPMDNGPHLIIGAYCHFLEFLRTIGSRHLLQDPGAIRYLFQNRKGDKRLLACPGWLPAPLHLLAGLIRFCRGDPRDLISALRLARDLERSAKNAGKEEQTRSVTEWLQRDLKQSDRLFQQLWGPLTLAALNEPPASAEAGLFAEVLRRAFLEDPQGALPLFPTAPLSQLIAEPALALIQKQGGSIRLGCRVTGFNTQGDQLLNIQTKENPIDLRGGRIPVISTLPPQALGRLLPQWSDEQPWSNLASAPIVSVHLDYGRPLRLPFPLLGLPFHVSQWFMDRGALQSLPHGAFSAVISGAYREMHWSRSRLADQVRVDLEGVLPELRGKMPLAQRVIRERHATFAAWPGSTQQRPEIKTPWRNLWLAGDWTATGLPATLEGATLSGLTVAKRIVNR